MAWDRDEYVFGTSERVSELGGDIECVRKIYARQIRCVRALLRHFLNLMRFYAPHHYVSTRASELNGQRGPPRARAKHRDSAFGTNEVPQTYPLKIARPRYRHQKPAVLRPGRIGRRS